jgi:hypothetical protein
MITLIVEGPITQEGTGLVMPQTEIQVDTVQEAVRIAQEQHDAQNHQIVVQEAMREVWVNL